MTDGSSLRSDGPVDADGLCKAVDGYEVRQERIRPPLHTSPLKTGLQTPVFNSAHRPCHHARDMRPDPFGFDRLIVGR